MTMPTLDNGEFMLRRADEIKIHVGKIIDLYKHEYRELKSDEVSQIKEIGRQENVDQSRPRIGSMD